MKITNKFRTKDKVEFESDHGYKVYINQNTFAVEIDCNVKVFFTRGAQQFYNFMQNSNYYQTDEIKFINVLKDPDALIDTVDNAYYDNERVYSVLLLHDIVFLMFDEE